MICDRPVDAVEAAVEGLWVLYAATWASARAVRARPIHAVRRRYILTRRRANICGETHASQPCGRAQGHPATVQRIGPRPIAGYSPWPFRSRERSVLQ